MLSRRELLAAAPLLFLSRRYTDNPLFGWKDFPQARRLSLKSHRLPYIHQQNKDIRGSGKGRVVMLTPYLVQAQGCPFEPHMQKKGDCVGFSFATGVDILTAVQIYFHKKPERWIAEASSEIIYAGSRIEIGEGRIVGAGSIGSWAADWLQQYGVILRKKYPSVNLTEYDPELTVKLGREGVPDELEPLAREHPVKTAALVRTWEECRDSVANGYPVTLSSRVGYGDSNWSGYWERDSQGFLRRSRRGWPHSMVIVGIDDKNRKGACLQNSWGDVFSGPTQHDQPAGSFWADARNVEAALRDEDSYALSNYKGYPRVDIPDYDLY